MIAPETIRTALARLLASETLRGSDQLRRFLDHVCRRTLDGDTDSLKEMVLGLEVFDRPTSFDPRLDPVVRTAARRLRAKLAEYYSGEGRDDHVVITLPKGTYVPTFEARAPGAPPVTGATAPAASGARLAPSESGGVAPAATPARRFRLRGSTGRWIAAAALLLLAGTTGLLVWQHARSTTSRPTSVAVIPFDSLSADPENEFFANGFVDALTTELSRRDRLSVTARTSAAAFRRGQDVTEIGRKLGVDAIIEGSVQRAGTHLRVVVQLIDAANGRHLWSERYDRPLADPFGVQDELTAVVSREVTLRLGAAAGTAAPTPLTRDAQARELYWKARYYRAQRSAEGRQKTVALLEQAVARDPAFAAAHAMLADVARAAAFRGEGDFAAAIARARAAATRALALDGRLADAHTTLGVITIWVDRRWLVGEQHLRRALALNPSSAVTRDWYALALAMKGRFDEAVAESRRAIELDPLSYLVSNDLAVILYCARRYDESMRRARQVLDTNPGFTYANAVMAICDSVRGRADRAVTAFEGPLKAADPASDLRGRYGFALAAAGQVARARELARDLEAQAAAGQRPYIHVAYVHAGLADRDRALASLARAFDSGEFDALFAGVDPMFDSLRTDPRFSQALAAFWHER